jgi:hyperosmotically inducible periplasmic protein
MKMSIAQKVCAELLVISASLFLAASVPAGSVHQDAQQSAADNTKNNRDKSAATADDQKMNPADRQLTKKIRASLVGDKSLSTYAHNIKIISQDGRVTLRGPVRSEEEKAAVEAKATAIAGVGNVTNLLEVAPPKS